MASSSLPGQKNGKGRQKVKMEMMGKKSNLQVTFSKRRCGLFKKGSELSTLTRSKIAIIVFSPGRKVYSFGHPTVHQIVDKCFPRYDMKGGILGAIRGRGCNERLAEVHRSASVAELNRRLSAIKLEMETEKGRGAALVKRQRAELGSPKPMDRMGLGELEELAASLHALKDRVAMAGRLAGGIEPDLQGYIPIGKMGNSGLSDHGYGFY